MLSKSPLNPPRTEASSGRLPVEDVEALYVVLRGAAGGNVAPREQDVAVYVGDTCQVLDFFPTYRCSPIETTSIKGEVKTM